MERARKELIDAYERRPDSAEELCGLARSMFACDELLLYSLQQDDSKRGGPTLVPVKKGAASADSVRGLHALRTPSWVV